MKTNLKIVGDLSQINLEEIAAKRQTLKNEIKMREKEFQSYNDILSYAAMHAPDLTIFAGPFKIMLIESKRDHFDLKTARALLGEDVLKPFISKIFSTSLRVN